MFPRGSTTATYPLSGVNYRRSPGMRLQRQPLRVWLLLAWNSVVSVFPLGSTVPTSALTGLDGAGVVAVSPKGTVYVGNYGNDTVSVFAAGSTTPTTALTGVGQPEGMACDSNGNLYVLSYGGGTEGVSEFTPGSTTPAALLAGMEYPEGMACDGSGNLYVADEITGVNVFAAGSPIKPTLGGVDHPLVAALACP